MIKSGSNALTYGTVPSAPASISPVDIESWNARIEPEFKHYFNEKYNELVSQYTQLVEEYNINKLMYESNISFTPVIGKTYYLYERADGSRFISILSLKDTGWKGYIGAFRLKAQYTWERIDEN